MFGKLVCLAAFVTLGSSVVIKPRGGECYRRSFPTYQSKPCPQGRFGAAPTCVPDQKDFYWISPCSGQKFENIFTPTDIKCTQNGQLLDSLGGIDAALDLTCVITIDNTYDKTISDPLVDIALQNYSTSLGKCKWNDVPTLGVLNNLNMCDFVDNCHMDNPADPTTFRLTVNIAQLAGSFIGILNADTYYRISLTFKDGKNTELGCAYVQESIVIVPKKFPILRSDAH